MALRGTEPTESHAAGQAAPDHDAGRALAVAALSVARAFAAGATMWCWAPEWPEHAQHVAVEFVHPVIVGKRALAAVAVDTPDPTGTLRSTAAAGDVLVVVGAAGAPLVPSVLRRAGIWGLTTVWIGAGDLPPPGAADHVLWAGTGATADVARFDGSVVQRYHLLWELTHVCFEHPGLLRSTADAGCVGDVCVTCSDEGRPAEVLSVGADGAAAVRSAQGVESVDTTLVGPVAPGDLVLVHAGTALTVLDG